MHEHVLLGKGSSDAPTTCIGRGACRRWYFIDDVLFFYQRRRIFRYCSAHTCRPRYQEHIARARTIYLVSKMHVPKKDITLARRGIAPLDLKYLDRTDAVTTSVQRYEKDLLPVLEVFPLIREQPEDATKAVRELIGEQRTT